MSDFKGTKGNWLMNVTKRFIDNDGLAITCNDKLICRVSHDLCELPIDEYIGNAQLIHAAPNLLEALQTLQTAIGYAAENNCVYAISKQDIDLIEAAILKAVQP